MAACTLPVCVDTVLCLPGVDRLLGLFEGTRWYQRARYVQFAAFADYALESIREFVVWDASVNVDFAEAAGPPLKGVVAVSCRMVLGTPLFGTEESHDRSRVDRAGRQPRGTRH